MKKRKKTGYGKTVLSLLLVVMMLFGLCPQVAFAATDVTLTFKNGAAQDGASRYLLYFDHLDDTDVNKYWNNNTIYIDGKAVSGDGVHYTHLSDGFALLLNYNVIEEGVTTAAGLTQSHTLQIKSGTSMANGEYTVANDVWLKLDGYTVTQLTPVNLTHSGGGPQDAAARFQLKFSGFPDTVDRYWNGMTVYIDGQPVSGEGVHFLPDSSDGIALYLSYSVMENVTSYVNLGTHILELPAGTLLGSYVVNKGLKFQLSASGIKQIFDPDVTVTLSNDASRNQAGNATSGFYFYASPADELASDVTNWSVRYSMTTGGIYVNGTVVPGAKLIKLTSNLYYVSVEGCDITYAAGDVVTVNGTVTSDGYTVAYTEESFQYDGNGNWDIYSPVVGNNFALDTSDSGAWQSANSRYLVWLTDDISGEKKALGTVQLLVDGKTQSVETYLSADGRYALLLNATCGITEKGEHSIQITAGQTLGEYTVLNDAVFYTHADGSVNTTAPKIVTLNLDTADPGGWQGALSRYLLWLSDDITGEKAAVGTLQLLVDGQMQSVETYLSADGRYALILNSTCGITEQGNYTLEIPAGTNFGSYTVSTDLKIQISGSSFTQAYAPDVTVTLSNDNTRNKMGNCTYGFYFYVSPADELTSDVTNWSIRYSMTTGGIYVNDALVSAAKLVKLTANLYYVSVDGSGITFVADDMVKIAGTVTSDGYTVEYSEAYFQYDGNGCWNICEMYDGNVFALDTTDPGSWQEEHSRYLVWLTDDISDEKTELGTVQLLVDGEAQNVATALIDGRYALILDADCGINEPGEHCVLITAGQALGAYTAAKNVTIYTHADGSIDKFTTTEVGPIYYNLDFGDFPVDFDNGASVDGVKYEYGSVISTAGDHELVYTDMDGRYKRTLVLYRLGDLNADDTVDLVDLFVMKKHLNDSRELSLAGQKAADMNLDNAVNGDDLSNLRKHFLEDRTIPNTGYSTEDMENLVDFTVEVESGRDIRVLQLTDTQIIESEQQRTEDRLGEIAYNQWLSTNKDEMYHKYVTQVVENYDPDLILLTGDLIYGEFDDSGEAWLELIEFMDSFQIPWAPIMGNHEGESHKGVDWQCQQLANSEYCLFEQRTLTGNGNYTVGLKQDGKYKRVFFMLDSNGSDAMSSESLANGHSQTTAGFGEDQIQWYTNLAEKMRYAQPDIKLSAAFHIQIRAFAKAYAQYGYSDSSILDNPINIDTIENAAETDFGYIGNSLQKAWDKDDTVFYSLKNNGFDSFYIGHEHCNSASVVYRGVRFQFGQKSSTYDAFNYQMPNGAIVGGATNQGTPIIGGTAIPIQADGSLGIGELLLYEAPEEAEVSE